MRTRRIFRTVQPYITAIAVILVGALLVFAIYFTELGLQWVTFLTGILIASILAMTTRASRTEWVLLRRTSQVTALKDKLEQEKQLHSKAAGDYQQVLSLLQQTEKSFGRLIPHQLLKLLDRDNINDVKLGDQIERKLTVMFTDIRNFTTLSESMTPQENFNFLNSYLSLMEPIIGSHRGIIDKYVGDTILALFTQGADDALTGALEMLEKLDKYNAGRANAGYAPIHVGFGLNTGYVMIGTIGGAGRMESTVIGDAVNLTARIEEATKTYQSPLLISQNTLYDLTNPSKYDIRFLDRIRVKGKTQPLSIYEVFDNAPIKVRDGKRYTKAKFEEAIACYHLENIPRAIELLTHCIEITPQDIPAQIYLDRCQEYMATGQHTSTGELNNHMEWRAEFQTGIEAIDRSHKRLFDLVNLLISATTSGNIDTVREIFSLIESSNEESLGLETELMHRNDYPFLDSHLHEHNRFIENLAALREEVHETTCELPFLAFRSQLLFFDWFSGHIAKSDRHMGRHLINHALSRTK
ncbi:MAG: adenylate/guanylate cyclase domain-containing protein [Gallionellaceae bacterium]